MNGRLLIWLGLGLSVLGLLMIYAPGLLSWFGKLPGDIRIRNENSTVFIPVSSMLVVSAILSVIVNLFFRG